MDTGLRASTTKVSPQAFATEDKFEKNICKKKCWMKILFKKKFDEKLFEKKSDENIFEQKIKEIYIF